MPWLDLGTAARAARPRSARSAGVRRWVIRVSIMARWLPPTLRPDAATTDSGGDDRRRERDPMVSRPGRPDLRAGGVQEAEMICNAQPQVTGWLPATAHECGAPGLKTMSRSTASMSSAER